MFASIQFSSHLLMSSFFPYLCNVTFTLTFLDLLSFFPLHISNALFACIFLVASPSTGNWHFPCLPCDSCLTGFCPYGISCHTSVVNIFSPLFNFLCISLFACASFPLTFFFEILFPHSFHLPHVFPSLSSFSSLSSFFL